MEYVQPSRVARERSPSASTEPAQKKRRTGTHEFTVEHAALVSDNKDHEMDVIAPSNPVDGNTQTNVRKKRPKKKKKPKQQGSPSLSAKPLVTAQAPSAPTEQHGSEEQRRQKKHKKNLIRRQKKKAIVEGLKNKLALLSQKKREEEASSSKHPPSNPAGPEGGSLPVEVMTVPDHEHAKSSSTVLSKEDKDFLKSAKFNQEQRSRAKRELKIQKRQEKEASQLKFPYTLEGFFSYIDSLPLQRCKMVFKDIMPDGYANIIKWLKEEGLQDCVRYEFLAYKGDFVMKPYRTALHSAVQQFFELSLDGMVTAGFLTGDEASNVHIAFGERLTRTSHRNADSVCPDVTFHTKDDPQHARAVFNVALDEDERTSIRQDAKRGWLNCWKAEVVGIISFEETVNPTTNSFKTRIELYRRGVDGKALPDGGLEDGEKMEIYPNVSHDVYLRLSDFVAAPLSEDRKDNKFLLDLDLLKQMISDAINVLTEMRNSLDVDAVQQKWTQELKERRELAIERGDRPLADEDDDDERDGGVHNLYAAMVNNGGEDPIYDYGSP